MTFPVGHHRFLSSQAGLVKVLHAAVRLRRLVTLHPHTLPQEAWSSSPSCRSSSSSSPTSTPSSGTRRLQGWSRSAIMRRSRPFHVLLLLLIEALAALGDPVLRSVDTWNSWYSLDAPLDPLGPSRSHVLSYKASEDLSNVVVDPIGHPR